MYQQPKVNETLPSQGAINKFFAQHYEAALRTANRILRSTEDSDDAVQTAYCAAFRHFHRFRGESSFKTWITRIVVNCCLMKLRDRRARPRVPLDDVERTVASHAATPEVLRYLAELQAAHASAASRLPKLLHDVYAESVISGIALPKVAEQLGLTAIAAKSRLFRARRRVEHALQPVIQRRAACRVGKARERGVILAGGDGTRLQCLTTQIEGDTRPKQFCRMLGDHSLLTQTRRRISPLFEADKVITVVTKKHEAFYSRELTDWPPTTVIAQPENLEQASRLLRPY